jgi:uncharacterized protein YfaP (DUF2135 family)
MQTGEASLGGTPSGQWRRESGADRPAVLSLAYPIETLSQPDNQRVEAVIWKQDVRAEPNHEPGYSRLGGHPKRYGDVLGVAGQEHGGGSADAVGRVASYRFGIAYLSHYPPS